MSDTIYLQPGAQVTVDGGEAGQLTIKASPSSMTWTTAKPTKEGWYWFRSKAEGPIVVRIYGSWVPTDNYKLNVWVGGLPDETDCNIESMEDGEWYGPLEIPS